MLIFAPQRSLKRQRKKRTMPILPTELSDNLLPIALISYGLTGFANSDVYPMVELLAQDPIDSTRTFFSFTLEELHKITTILALVAFIVNLLLKRLVSVREQLRKEKELELGNKFKNKMLEFEREKWSGQERRKED